MNHASFPVVVIEAIPISLILTRYSPRVAGRIVYPAHPRPSAIDKLLGARPSGAAHIFLARPGG